MIWARERIIIATAIVPLALIIGGCTTDADRARNQYSLRRDQGQVAERDGEIEEAETRYKQALEIAEKTWGENHPNTAASLTDIGLLYLRKGDPKSARPLFERALAIREKVLGHDDVAVSDSLMLLAATNESLGQLKEAQKELADALAIREKKLPPDDLDLARCLERVAGCYWKQGDYNSGEPLLRRALTIREKHPDKARGELPRCLNNLAAVYYHQGKYKQSESLYRRALALEESMQGKDSLAVSWTLDSYAKVVRKTGRNEEAEQLEARAAHIRSLALNPETKRIFEQCARDVTLHLLDKSYTSYAQSQAALGGGELAEPVADSLKKLTLLARSKDELASTVKELSAKRQVSNVHIDSVRQLPPDRHGYVPYEITATVKTSADKKAETVSEFTFAYVVGLNTETNQPAVLGFEDRTAKKAEPPKVGTAPGAPPGPLKR